MLKCEHVQPSELFPFCLLLHLSPLVCRREQQESRDAQFALQLQNQQLRLLSSNTRRNQQPYNMQNPHGGNTYYTQTANREPPPLPPQSENQVNKFFKKLGGGPNFDPTLVSICLYNECLTEVVLAAGAKNAWGKFSNKFKKVSFSIYSCCISCVFGCFQSLLKTMLSVAQRPRDSTDAEAAARFVKT